MKNRKRNVRKLWQTSLVRNQLLPYEAMREQWLEVIGVLSQQATNSMATRWLGRTERQLSDPTTSAPQLLIAYTLLSAEIGRLIENPRTRKLGWKLAALVNILPAAARSAHAGSKRLSHAIHQPAPITPTSVRRQLGQIGRAGPETRAAIFKAARRRGVNPLRILTDSRGPRGKTGRSK